MRAAFTIHNDRIAPVFDVAGTAVVVEDPDGRETVPLVSGSPYDKLRQMAELDVGVVVCGAMSRPLHEFAREQGLEVHAFVAGATDEVVEAWRAGRLRAPEYAMPGCGRGARRCGRRRRGRGGPRCP